MNLDFKYIPIDESLKEEYSNLLESCVQYLNTKENLELDVKIAATYVVSKLVSFHQSIPNNLDYKSIIDEYIKYYNKFYPDYIDNIDEISDSFYTHLTFINTYLKTLFQ